MVISGFEWDDDNVLHIERHQFSHEEVEEVFAGDYKVRRTRHGSSPWAKRWTAVWHLSVFRRLPEGLIRVVTARDMDDSERRMFRRK